MSPSTAFALKRSGLLYGGLAAACAVAGAVWAATEHHDYGFCFAFFYYTTAAVVITIGTFSQMPIRRKDYLKLTIDERNKAFSNHMWMFAIGATLGATGGVLQLLF